MRRPPLLPYPPLQAPCWDLLPAFALQRQCTLRVVHLFTFPYIDFLCGRHELPSAVCAAKQSPSLFCSMC